MTEAVDPTMLTTRAVTSAQWSPRPGNIDAVINGVACTVPTDPGNMEYQAILAWQAAGGTIAEPPVVATSPA